MVCQDGRHRLNENVSLLGIVDIGLAGAHKLPHLFDVAFRTNMARQLSRIFDRGVQKLPRLNNHRVL
jgi:hypothetical protein